jgi:hypothetical protein
VGFRRVDSKGPEGKTMIGNNVMSGKEPEESEKSTLLKDVEFCENTIECDKDSSFHKPCIHFKKCDIATHGKIKSVVPILEMEDLNMYCMTYESK